MVPTKRIRPRIFLDTNILVYAFDGSAPAKQKVAREIARSEDWIISWQVIQEFCHVALHRFAVPMKPGDLTEYLEIVLWPRCAVLPSLQLYQNAAQWHQTTQYRFYDCLMVAGAISGGANLLYSEDLQAGRQLDVLQIENPFDPKPAAH